MSQRHADPQGVAIGMAEMSPKHLEEQLGREQERLALPIREAPEVSASVGHHFIGPLRIQAARADCTNVN